MKKLLYSAFLVVLAACGNENPNEKTDAAEDPELNQAQVPVNANGNIADTMGLPDRPLVDSTQMNDSN